jgi:hypothetical protein
VDSQVQIRDQLGRELAQAAAPPLGSLVADAMATGVRTRRRRRYAVAASGLAALSIMVAAGVFLSGRPVGPTAVIPGAATSAPPPSRHPKAAPETTPPVPVPVPAGHRATTGEAVAALLAELLPVDGDLSAVDLYVDTNVAAASLLFDDGRGRATVSAGVADRPADYGPTVSGMQCPPDDDGFVCEHEVLPGGLEVRVLTLGPYDCTDAKCGIINVRVELARPDGVHVMVDAYNGPMGGGRPPTRDAVLLDADEMLTIARDPRWGLTMEASFVDAADARY